MPIIGYFVGRSFASYVIAVDHWIAFGLLMLIGLNMIRETIKGEDETLDADFGLRAMLLMAVATSIDAMAVGVSMAFLDVNIWVSALVIGVVTLIISALGVCLGRLFGSRLGSNAGIAGGVILIGIGAKILIEHLGA
jgi:putative Mn2+ efflux pump MntP